MFYKDHGFASLPGSFVYLLTHFVSSIYRVLSLRHELGLNSPKGNKSYLLLQRVSRIVDVLIYVYVCGACLSMHIHVGP